MVKGKKATAVPMLAGAIILVILVAWIMVIAARECDHDSDCGENNYCGSDFKCHKHQIITVERNNLVVPSIVLSVSIIIAALLLRTRKIKERYI